VVKVGNTGDFKLDDDMDNKNKMVMTGDANR
jgi:hypothetical protein